MASIIGSGFLIVAPALYQDLGRSYFYAMILVNHFALAVGWLMRTNIGHIEPLLKDGYKNTRLVPALERVSVLILDFFCIIAIAFYLTLLSSFALQALDISSNLNFTS